jgi:hypothetical protein
MDHGTDKHKGNAACKDASNQDAHGKDKALCAEKHQEKVNCTDPQTKKTVDVPAKHKVR